MKTNILKFNVLFSSCFCCGYVCSNCICLLELLAKPQSNMGNAQEIITVTFTGAHSRRARSFVRNPYICSY